MNSQNVSLSSKRRDPKSHPITSYNYMEVSVWSWYPKLHHPCDFQIHSKPSSIIQLFASIIGSFGSFGGSPRLLWHILGVQQHPLMPGAAGLAPDLGSQKMGFWGMGTWIYHICFPEKKGTSHDKPWFWSLTIKPLFCQDCLLFSLFGGYIADSNIFKL
jgi:hypothetical protein